MLRRAARIAGLPLFVATLFLSAAHAAPECSSRTLKVDPTWREHRHDKFIIQYAVEGRHALQSVPKEPASTASPDIIKDIALQLATMRDMLAQMGFQHPFDSERYGSRGVTHVLVRLQDLKRLTGRAFDELRRLPTGECVLIIHINNNYRSGSLTPAHEYFHLVQYGYTMFKRPWFLEGTARWAENILGNRDVKATPPPQTRAEQEQFFRRSYRAVSDWYGLIEYCDPDPSSAPVPDNLASLRYSAGAAVVEGRPPAGHGFIRRVMEALGTQDHLITVRDSLTKHRWPERVQRKPSHDKDMWNAVAQACARPLPLTE